MGVVAILTHKCSLKSHTISDKPWSNPRPGFYSLISPLRL